MGYYDYEDPIKYEKDPKKKEMMMMMMMNDPDYQPSLTRRVMNVISPFSGLQLFLLRGCS
jgi:hypothetical protein